MSAIESPEDVQVAQDQISPHFDWVIFAFGILALPWIAWTREFALAADVSLAVLAEGLVLALNHGRCPLTNVAAGPRKIGELGKGLGDGIRSFKSAIKEDAERGLSEKQKLMS